MTNNFKNRDRRIPNDPLKDAHAANEKIRVPNVRLIDSEGQNLGVRSTQDAQKMANSKELDLVIISPTADPPVARICDYGKFIYEQKQHKKEQDRKSRESTTITKEIQLRPAIGQHDLDVKLNHAKEWLSDNCKIKIVLKFRGREMAHKDLGFAVINGFLEKLENCKIERRPEMNSNTIIAMVAPGLKSDKQPN